MSTPQPLTREQAQAIADVVIANHDIYSWSIYDELSARFPDVDWVSLCAPNAADPRERSSSPAFIGPKLPNEASRVMDRRIKEYIAAVTTELSKPALLTRRLAP